MKVFVIFAALFCGLAAARDNRLSEECLRGITDANICCEGVPDAWYAHLRNPQDCTKFYQCEHGKPTLKDCALGTHWSVEADLCDHPSEAKCVDEQPGTDSTTKAPVSTTSAATTTSGTPSTTTGPTTTPAPNPNPIPEEDECAPEPVCHQCLNGVFPADLCCRDVETYHKLNLADAKDCNSYYQCVNGHEIHRQCPDGLHWSVNTDRCEWPQVAQCNNNGAGNDTGDGNDDDNNTGDGDGVVSDDCRSGKVSSVECCRNVPYWVDVLLQNNADCHTFIQCVHGKPMVRPCPAELWWSITHNRCEWKARATCTW